MIKGNNISLSANNLDTILEISNGITKIIAGPNRGYRITIEAKYKITNNKNYSIIDMKVIKASGNTFYIKHYPDAEEQLDVASTN